MNHEPSPDSDILGLAGASDRMTDRFDDLREALDLVERYRPRIIAILDGAPYWKGSIDFRYSWYELDEDECVLHMPCVEGDYDGWYNIEEDTPVRFPARLLFLNETEFSAWKVRAREEYDRKQVERKQQVIEEQHRKELAEYNRLRAKFA